MLEHTATVAEQLLQSGFGVVSTANTIERLPSITRELAARALAGEYGRQMAWAGFGLPEAQIAELSPARRYAETVRLIAQQAPLRVVPLERLVGASTLLEAPHHMTPATAPQPIRGTSHTTLDFEKALRVGYQGIRSEIHRRLERGVDEAGEAYLTSMLICIDAAGTWHERYVAELSGRVQRSGGLERQRYQEILDVMQHVPERSPRTFYEAVQALWELWEFQRLCGNWSGLGRVDKMLGPYLERDLGARRITLDEARDLLAHFWIKGAEWIGCNNQQVGTSGDAQFYQNVVLGGIDEQGQEVTNPVTYLILDVVEELHISDYSIAVRVSRNTPERLWRRIAEVQRMGGGIVSIYNEKVVIRALTRFGFPLREARNFSNDGCWEVLIPGKSCFSYTPFDTLQLLQDAMGTHPDRPTKPDYASFEALYAAFTERLTARIGELYDATLSDNPKHHSTPTLLIDLWVEGCIDRARGYFDAGPKYTIRAPHAGGLPDVANSLYAIKRWVFDQKRLSFARMRDILQDDWAGHERLQSEAWHRLVLYGSDDDGADAMLQRVFDTYVTTCERTERKDPRILRPAGISTFGREIEWRSRRAATPFGRNAGDVLASNLAPTPGSERYGPTAVIKSYTKLDFERLPNGVPLDLKLFPTSVRGETGIAALVALLKTFVSLGGWYIQPDVMDSEMLRDAQAHPERYPNLTVRISGWSARFATLDKEWQDMVIQRTAHQL